MQRGPIDLGVDSLQVAESQVHLLVGRKVQLSADVSDGARGEITCCLLEKKTRSHRLLNGSLWGALLRNLHFNELPTSTF